MLSYNVHNLILILVYISNNRLQFGIATETLKVVILSDNKDGAAPLQSPVKKSHVPIFEPSITIPKEWKRCPVQGENSPSCLRKAIQSAIGNLTNGNDELEIQPLDPLWIPYMDIDGAEIVSVDQHFKDVNLYGISETKILEADVDLDQGIIRFSSTTPKLLLVGKYEMKGRIMMMPIEGDGNCKIKLYDTLLNHTLTGETYEEDKNIFMRIKDYNIGIYPDKINSKFDDLFMGELYNKDLNDNWETYFLDVRAGYEDTLGRLLKELTNKLFTKVPLKGIFLID